MGTTSGGKTKIGIGAGLLVMWELAAGILYGQGKLAWIPDILVAFAFVVPIAYFAYVVLGKYAAKYRIVALILFILVGALLGYGAWLLTFKAGHLIAPKSPGLTTEQGEVVTVDEGGTPAPLPNRHPNTFTPQEIRAQLEQLGPLERDEVAEQFRHGIADWILIFEKDDLVRHRGTNLMTVRFHPVNSPQPRINCPEVKLEGNAYLGRIRSPTRFRVKGVIEDVSLNAITLHEASFEQLPDIVTTPAPETSPKAVPSPTETRPQPTPTSARRPVKKFTPREIHSEMARTAPLELKEVGASFIGGVVDWTLRFSSVHGSRGDPYIHVNFVPDDEESRPIIACTQIPLKGNEYLGNIKPPARFRVRGVISDVQENVILLKEVTVEQIPTSPTPVKPAPSTPSAQTPSKPAPPSAEREVGPKNIPPKKEPEVLADANEVFGIFNGRTAINVIELLKPHTGEVIEVTGKLYNLSPNLTAIVQIEVGPVIICNFNAEWTEKLRALNPGDAMRVRGKIAPGQGGHGLDLKMCELLSSTPP